MNQKQLSARFKELDRMHGRHPLWMKVLVTDLLNETERLRLAEPSAVFGEPGGCLNVVWQRMEGRVTVFTEDDHYTIEVVPRGPVDAFSTDQVEIAGAYLAGLFTGFSPPGGAIPVSVPSSASAGETDLR